MCGIFGFAVAPQAPQHLVQLSRIVVELFCLSESRGREAAGIVVAREGRLQVRKAPIRGAEFITDRETIRVVNEFLMPAKRDSVNSLWGFAGHTRMVTNGDSSSNANNQPVVGERVAVIHNGIVVNDADLWKAHPTLTRQAEVDTEVVVRLIEASLDAGTELHHAVAAASEQVQGGNSYAVVDPVDSTIVLGTTNGSLYVAVAPDRDLVLFASERVILQRLFAKRRLIRNSGDWQIEQVPAGSWVRLDGASETVRLKWGILPSARSRGRQVRTSRSEPAHFVDACRRLEASIAVNFDSVASLRRCAQCVLPETFPGLTFDRDGVCSVCVTSPPIGNRPLGELQLPRAGNGRVLLPISGGRDSCYAAHYLHVKQGVRLVAYTYDWGMVTDLARRNISRMCGELGVEHILISADIAKKRANIRRNLLAWIRKPHLGTIPLLMAGDKHFFYFAQQLRRQMELDLIVFSMNPFERTDFKAGFAGVGRWGTHERRHYDLRRLGKARIAAFYAGQALANPKFLNPSVIDSLSGYLSYYAIPKRFESLYDYLPWKEDEIDATLLETYGWETADDSTSTWRVGDGTAPFYNYVYLKVAGFTENDALRSNQVREGHISRNDAMAKTLADNQVRLQSLAWYFDAIGVDGVAVLRAVNAMRTLY